MSGLGEQIAVLDGLDAMDPNDGRIGQRRASVTQYGSYLMPGVMVRKNVLDASDGLVCYLGDNEQVCDVAGWPNNRNEAGEVVPTSLLEPGKFNSPHGMAVDADGNIYAAEWLIGGRFTKLVKL